MQLSGLEDRNFVLAVSLKSGVILLMKNFDDVSPVQLRTGLLGVCMEWSNSRELLAVAGTRANTSGADMDSCTNVLLFYSDTGSLIYSAFVPSTQVIKVSNIFCITQMICKKLILK